MIHHFLGVRPASSRATSSTAHILRGLDKLSPERKLFFCSDASHANSAYKFLNRCLQMELVEETPAIYRQSVAGPMNRASQVGIHTPPKKINIRI